MVIGAEPTPLLAYGVGLFLAQGAVLLIAARLSRTAMAWLGQSGRNWLAALWVGLGAALTWSAITG